MSSEDLSLNHSLILNYHHIVPGTLINENLLFGYAHSTENFAVQMQWLCKKLRPTLDWKQRGGVVITFDDCSMHTYHQALPILEHHGVKAYFFVVESRLGRSLWIDRYFQWLSYVPNGKYQIGNQKMSLNSATERMNAHQLLWNQVHSDTTCILEQMDSEYAFDKIDKRFPELADRMRTIGQEEIEYLKSKGHLVGHHSRTHTRLSALTGEGLKEEVTMQNSTLFNTKAFAIPFGSSSDYNSEVIDIIRANDYSTILLNHPSPPKADTFGRLNLPNSGNIPLIRFHTWQHIRSSK